MYNYELEKAQLFQPENQKEIARILMHLGATKATNKKDFYTHDELFGSVFISSSWQQLAIIDALIELGCVRQDHRTSSSTGVFSQHRLYNIL